MVSIFLSKKYSSFFCSLPILPILFAGISEELTAKNQELTDAVLELQRELREATEQYGELEAKLKERDVALEVTTEKKNLCIQELKKELEHANQLMEAVKQRE